MGTTETTWSEVARALAPPRNYWLISLGPDGSPHAAPVWGVAVAEELFLYSERSTVKAHNLAIDPRVVIHLESGDDVVIVHGRVQDLGHPYSRPDVVAAFDVKYPDPEDVPYLPSADDAFDALYSIRPHRALMWQMHDFDNTQLRWAPH